jgi:hypothetical protein
VRDLAKLAAIPVQAHRLVSDFWIIASLDSICDRFSFFAVW